MNFQKKDNYTIQDLLNIVAILRDKDNGCPWDKVQTHKSIRKNFIEETYEVLEAIDLDDKKLLQEELGDVLLQILLHSQFESEINTFDFNDVVNSIAQKIVFRHPYVFSYQKNKTYEEGRDIWDKQKSIEKKQTTISQTLDAIPNCLPALMYTQKLQKRMAKSNMSQNIVCDSIDIGKQKILDIVSNKDKFIEENYTKLLFEIVNIMRLSKIDSEEQVYFHSKQQINKYKKIEENLLHSK